MNNNQTRHDMYRAFYSGCAGILSSLIALYGMLMASVSSAVAFLVAAALLIVVAMVIYLVWTYKARDISTKQPIPSASRIGFVGTLFLFVILFYGFLQADDGYSGADVSCFWWHQHPTVLVIVMTIAMGIVLYVAMRRFHKNRIPNVVWDLYYVVMSIPYAMSAVYLNVFSGDLFHIDAYVHPLYSVYFSEPYSETSYSIYGHYELFYLPFLKLLGIRPRVMSALLFCICILVALLILYVIHQLVENPWIRWIAPLALCVPTGCMFRSTSYQTTPHRLLFGMMLLAYATYIRKRSYRKSQVVWGYVLCIFAVLWNTESGLICAVAWTAWYVMRVMYAEECRLRAMARCIGLGLLGIISSTAGALLIANLYNAIVGGVLFIRAFFYPFLNQQFLNHYEIPLYFRNYPYIYVMIMGCACVCYGLHRAYQQMDAGDSAVVALCGTIMLGLEAYYATRAAYYGLLIVTPFLLVAVCYFTNRCLTDVAETTLYTGIRKSLGIIGTMVLAGALAISTGLWSNLAVSVRDGKFASVHINNELDWIRTHVPQNTYAVGWGVDELYGYLGWDTGYHMLGTTDVVCDVEANKVVYDTLLDEIQNQPQVMLSMYMYNGMVLNHNLVDIDYSMTAEIDVVNYRYGLFERTGYKKPQKYDGVLNEIAENYQLDFAYGGDQYFSVNGWTESGADVQVGLQDPETGEVLVLDTNLVERPDGTGFYGKVAYEDYNNSARQEVVLILESKEGIIHTGSFVNEESE